MINRTLLSFITLTVIIPIINNQLTSQPHIESRKFSAISGQEAQTQVTPARVNYTVPYVKAFNRKPDVGLSIYNLQFDYNPQFSINVIQEISNLNNMIFYVSGNPSDSTVFNELYIMYIASEYDFIGIFMPGPQNTTLQLGIPSTIANRSQTFTFNFKNIGTQPIFPSNTQLSNIKVTVYLTGIQAQAESIQNGYSQNYIHFTLAISQITTRFYSVVVSVGSSFGDVTIQIVEFTVVYFDITQMAEKYQISSSSVFISNFGGTFFRSSVSLPLESLPQNTLYQNTLQYFFGISQLQCSSGTTINILAVQRFNYNNNGNLQNLVLTFETQRNTYINRAIFNYIQYKPRTCNNSASCGVQCNDPNQPSYSINSSTNLCAPCLYFCALCENGFNCTTCPSTRIAGGGGICICANNTLYDDQTSRQCQQCFDTGYCRTCQRKGVCLDCHINNNFRFNPVLQTCQCSPSFALPTPIPTPSLSSLNTTCHSCPQNCIYCLTPQTCESCTIQTYLSSSARTINGKVSACSPICKQSQIFDTNTRTCSVFRDDLGLYDSNGRLGFDWDLSTTDNKMIVDLVFSQRNMTYYVYQNGKGYQYVAGNNNQQFNNEDFSHFYYDDGNGYMGGFTNEAGSGIGSGNGNNVIDNSGTNTGFDQSSLKGEYYGLGQAQFYKEEYQKYDPKAQFYDSYGIPFGKHKLANITEPTSQNFLSALRNNLQFLLDGESLPYTITALSGNQFRLQISPQKTYLTTKATVQIKNPSLVRSSQTALQTSSITKQIDRIDYYTPNQLSTALNLKERTGRLSQILWGICKYLLFIGFGWPVMPLMLTLQYIFGYNYISSQLPLNLDRFLTSFADFRNPSILFNPQRNQFDRKVVNHPQIYKKVSAYQEFDRGIDFMKNSFQFFFVPLLSFALLFLLVLFNKLMNLVCKRDISIISRYLQPRAGLHAGAYTLVQALPISFFFFGQLQDTRYHSVGQPNSIYPSFNTGISFAAFFLSFMIPIAIFIYIYNYFKDEARTGKFSIQKLQGKEQTQELSRDPAMLSDPLWGGNPYKPLSYGFGATIFFLPLLAGFVLSYFTRTYPWQLTGLLLGFLLLTSYAIAANSFDNKILKYFWAGLGILTLGYLLVHAGIGSNRALSTYDQWNTGYLGIGLIYAMILAAAIFSGYLLYKLAGHIFSNIFRPHGIFPKLNQQAKLKVQPDQQQNLRDVVFGRDQRKKTYQSQSKINYLGSEDRMVHRDNGSYNDLPMNVYSQALLLQQTLPDGRSRFRCNESGNLLTFPRWSSRRLVSFMPLAIDSQNKIWAQNGRRMIGNVQQFMQQKQDSQITYIKNKQIQMINLQKQNNDINDAYQMVKNNNQKNNQNNTQYFIHNNTQLKFDSDNNHYYIYNYNGIPKYQANPKEFITLFSNGSNKIPYNGYEYYVQDSTKDGHFYLIDPSTYQISRELPYENFRTYLNNRVSQPLSTSLLSSHKNLQQIPEYEPGNQKRQVFTKNKERFLINGKTYQKIDDNGIMMFFKNIQTGEKMEMKKSDANFKMTKSQNKLNNLIELQLAETDTDQDLYYYENPLNQERYQIPIQLIDKSQPVYLDEAQNIWHQGKMLQSSSSGSSRSSSSLEPQQVNHTIPRVVTANSIPSSTSSISLGQTVNINDRYNVKLLTPNFKFLGNNIPEDKDILQRKDNVAGVNLINLIEEMRRVNPFGKIYVQNLIHQNEGFLVE